MIICGPYGFCHSSLIDHFESSDVTPGEEVTSGTISATEREATGETLGLGSNRLNGGTIPKRYAGRALGNTEAAGAGLGVGAP